MMLISLLLFLLIHLRALDKELKKIKEKEVYPWIGIYKDKTSSRIFLILIVILPLISCITVIYIFNFITLLKLFFEVLFSSIIGYMGYEIINITKTIKSSYL